MVFVTVSSHLHCLIRICLTFRTSAFMVPGLLEVDQALWICVVFEADIFCSLYCMLALLLPYPQNLESLRTSIVSYSS